MSEQPARFNTAHFAAEEVRRFLTLAGEAEGDARRALLVKEVGE